MASEMTEEEDEDFLCTINTEAQKDKIRRIIEFQKSVHFSSSSSSFSSASASCSFSSSHRSSSLTDLRKEGSTSLRRLFDMEHTSLATHLNDYSGSPTIKPVFLWGSDSEYGIHDDPWKTIKPTGPIIDSRSDDQSVTAAEISFKGQGSVYQNRKQRISKFKLTRTKSFRRLPRFILWRCRGFRFVSRLRKLRIMICGRKF